METVLSRIMARRFRRKHHKKREQLALTKKYLFDGKDAVEDDIVKRLFMGCKLDEQSLDWLDELESVVHQETEISKFRRTPRGKMLDDMVKHLDKSPLDHGRSIASPYGKIRLPTRGTNNNASRPVMETRRIESPADESFPSASTGKRVSIQELDTAETSEIIAAENPQSRMQAAMRDAEPAIQNMEASYDRLKELGMNNRRLRACDLQGCFLYCALLAKDQKVIKSKLVEYWMQEDLIAGNVADLSKKGHEIVEILINVALLEMVDDRCITMQDVVRDFALKILMPEIEAGRFLVRADSRRLMHPPNLKSSSSTTTLDRCLFKAGAGLKKAPSKKEWKEKMIFLMDNELSSLPESPNCPDLSILFLQGNRQLRVIPKLFFDHMPSLKVINLSKTTITSLPKSISKLGGLEKLILRDCEYLFELCSEVGELKCLDLLDLSGTDIYQLPEKIGELVSLKHLEVSFYGPLDQRGYSKLPSELIPQGIISRLRSLKILVIAVQPGDKRWDMISESVVIDLNTLENLTTLHFYFPEVDHLQLFLENSQAWKDGRLKKFNFVVGHDVKRMLSRVPRNVELDYDQQDRRLRFVNSVEPVPKAVEKVLYRTAAFYLDHHLNIRSLPGFGDGQSQLEFCVVRECPQIETLLDGKRSTFPHLEHLSIHYLESLKIIWSGLPSGGIFSSLKYLKVHTCPKLKIIFTSSTSHCIPNLEELVVEDCRAIEEIVYKDTKEQTEDVLLPRLKSLSLRYLPKLIGIWKGPWPSVEDVSFYDCPNLKDLCVGSNSRLIKSIKMIKAEKEWWSELQWEDTSLSHKLPVTYFDM